MQTKVIILAATVDPRLSPDKPKALVPLCNTPMINVLIKTVEQAGFDDITVVIGENMEALKSAVAPHKTVVQPKRLGTGDAAKAAAEFLEPFDGCVLILFADTPLLKVDTIKSMVRECNVGNDIVVLGFIPQDPRRYGRLIMGADGLDEIVEYKDATQEQRAIRLCNSGMICVNGRHVLELLEKISNKNAAGEYYLTDIVRIAKSHGLSRDVVICDPEEAIGINTPEELESAELGCKIRP